MTEEQIQNLLKKVEDGTSTPEEELQVLEMLHTIMDASLVAVKRLRAEKELKN
jgi:hypothetical protein